MKTIKKSLSTVLCATLFVGVAVCMIQKKKDEFNFPRPTGKYAVGKTSFCLCDLSRIDSPGKLTSNQLTEKNTKKITKDNCRKLTVHMWYPTSGKHTLSSTYADQDLPGAIIKSKIKVSTYSRKDAKILDTGKKYPLIIFGHGFGMNPTHYTSFCEEIASHGYIVMCVGHTHVTDISETRIKNLALVDECVADAKFVFDQIKNNNVSHISKNIDFKNVGSIGHSLGGILSANLCQRYDFCKAGMSLDGPLFGLDESKLKQRPFQFILASDFYQMFDGASDVLKDFGQTPKKYASAVSDFCKDVGREASQITIAGAQHNFFSDCLELEYVMNILLQQKVDFGVGKTKVHVMHLVKKTIVEFFGKHLKS